MGEAPRPDEILVMMAIADRGGCLIVRHAFGSKPQLVDPRAIERADQATRIALRPHDPKRYLAGLRPTEPVCYYSWVLTFWKLLDASRRRRLMGRGVRPPRD